MKFFATCGAIARVLDIIGDIHGHAERLEALLHALGYRHRGGAWQYPGNERRAIFVGDLIDRGPAIAAVISTVRAMVDRGSAHMILGNHEYNAIAWHTPDGNGGWLRAHNEVHRRQQAATQEQFASRPEELRAALEWFRTLPLFYEDAYVRVVHAAWHDGLVRHVRNDSAPLMDDDFLYRSSIPGELDSHAVEVLLKGVEMPLPRGAVYLDKEGTRRHKTRTRWWIGPDDQRALMDGAGTISLGAIAMPPADSELAHIRVGMPQLSHLPGYADERPVFFGHYWLTGTPSPLASRVACVDYSVANDGQLCAYRFDGEPELAAEKFTCV